jgi:tetratricopeptide (TPR) repeat protein
LASARAETDLNPPELEPIITAALEHAYRQEYDAARESVNRAVAAYPDNPAGYFFAGALKQLQMFDTGADSLECAFMADMQQAQNLAARLARKERNAWAWLYVGATYTYRAIYFGTRGRFWETYRWGIQAAAPLKQALKLDPNLSAACLGIGVSEYFHYSAGRYLTGLKLFGSLPNSIALVDSARCSAGYFSLTAQYALAWMYAHEQRHADACALLNDLLERYPGNRLFRKLLRDTYCGGKEYELAIAEAQGLGRELAETQPDNLFAWTENQTTLARSYFGNENYGEALASCDSIIAHEPDLKQVPGLAGFIRDARNIKKRLPKE